MKVKMLIDKLKHLPQELDVVIVLPKDAVPKENNSFNEVAYPINKVIIIPWRYSEIGITV